ncbi:tRNA adenosine deaminase-associated protein [Streptomyces sp. 8N114]|uniref:tRNA adenosine deaminase-associated protein n=1 Tax=unclassified Streptomyces TaxID=2593676 RepID=UPI003FD46E87
MYFAALLARTEDGWEASDTELDDVETLADLADLAREATTDDETVLVCIEQDGEWFGVVRVDGEDDPRVFVSDAAAAMRSSYGEILLSDELLGRQPEDPSALDQLVDLDGTEEGEPEGSEDDDGAAERAAVAEAESAPAGPLGDAELLSDLGMEEKVLLSLSPEDALSEVADALGCTDVLEAVR